MADLSNVGLNPDVEEAGAGFEVLPAGEYSVVITKDEIRDNKAGTGKLIVLSLKVTTGQYTGIDITDYINLTNANATAATIGQGVLKKICGLCSVNYPPNDTAALYGKPMNVKLSIEEFTSNTSGNLLQSNKVKAYKEVAAVAQATQQPVKPATQASAW